MKLISQPLQDIQALVDSSTQRVLVSLEVNLENKLPHWVARLGCSSKQLREAVRAVGPRLSDVRAYLCRLED